VNVQAINAVLHQRATARLVGRRTPRKRLPRQQQPDLIRGSYFIDLKYALAPMKRAVQSALWPLLPRLLERVQAEKARTDQRHDAGETHQAQAAVEAAQQHFFANFRDMGSIARAAGNATADFQKRQLQRQLRAAVGVEVPIRDAKLGPRLERYTTENVRLIKSIPSRYFAQVEQLVIEGVSEGRRWESLAVDIEERFNVAESSAQLVARDQVGKFFGELARVRQTELGITSYVWRTMNDERVREEHAALEGETFEWSEGDPTEGHPGQAVNCRCFADPDLEAVLDALE
jgi:SPP1 gp7 family putative phage head morphogenesis protein